MQGLSGSAMVFMILICGLVWGGFVGLLIRAARSESRKAGL